MFIKKVAIEKLFVTLESFHSTTQRPPPNYTAPKLTNKIMVCIGRKGDMDIMNKGKKLDKNKSVPEMNVAPNNLLKMIHCNYHSCLQNTPLVAVHSVGHKVKLDGVNLKHL